MTEGRRESSAKLSLADFDGLAVGAMNRKYPNLSTVSYGESGCSFASQVRLKTHNAITDLLRPEFHRHRLFPKILRIVDSPPLKGESYNADFDASGLAPEKNTLPRFGRSYISSEYFPQHYAAADPLFEGHESNKFPSFIIGAMSVIYKVNPQLGKEAAEETKNIIPNIVERLSRNQPSNASEHRGSETQYLASLSGTEQENLTYSLCEHSRELSTLILEEENDRTGISNNNIQYIERQDKKFEKIEKTHLGEHALLFEDAKVLDHFSGEGELNQQLISKLTESVDRFSKAVDNGQIKLPNSRKHKISLLGIAKAIKKAIQSDFME
jgi:hypothetical protein